MWLFCCKNWWSCATAPQFSMNCIWFWLADSGRDWFGPFCSKQIIMGLYCATSFHSPWWQSAWESWPSTTAVHLDPRPVYSSLREEEWNCHVVGTVVQHSPASNVCNCFKFTHSYWARLTSEMLPKQGFEVEISFLYSLFHGLKINVKVSCILVQKKMWLYCCGLHLGTL